MTLNDERAIDSLIKSGDIPSPVLIYGEEEYLKQRVLHRLMDRPDDAFAGFNDIRLDFSQLDLDELEEAVTTLPLMAGGRTVLVYDVTPKELNAERMKRLEKLFAAQAPGCRLLLLEKSGAVDDKRDEKSKKLLKLIDKTGAVFCLTERGAAALQKMVKADAARLGCEIAPGAQKALVDRVGGQMETLKSEVSKLCAYHGYQGEITTQDVERLTEQQPEDNIFGLSRAVLRDDYPGAMRILSDLFYLRVPPESILGTLCGYYVDLYRARVASVQKKQAAQIAADFGYGKRTFAVDNAMRDQRRLSEDYLCYALDTLARADLTLKSTQCDERAVLEQTVTALFLKERPGAARVS